MVYTYQTNKYDHHFIRNKSFIYSQRMTSSNKKISKTCGVDYIGRKWNEKEVKEKIESCIWLTSNFSFACFGQSFLYKTDMLDIQE